MKLLEMDPAEVYGLADVTSALKRHRETIGFYVRVGVLIDGQRVKLKKLAAPRASFLGADVLAFVGRVSALPARKAETQAQRKARVQADREAILA